MEIYDGLHAFYRSLPPNLHPKEKSQAEDSIYPELIENLIVRVVRREISR